MTEYTTETDLIFGLSSQKCTFLSCFLKPAILLIGLSSNIVFLIMVIKNNSKKEFSAQKPIRFLLIGMLISDIMYFASSINTFFVQTLKLPDINSYNIICQFNSYVSNYFIVLNECFMLIADYILFLLLFPPKNSSDIYAKYLVKQTTKPNRNVKVNSQSISMTDIRKVSEICTANLVSENEKK